MLFQHHIFLQKYNVVLHVADVGQGTAVLIEMQDTETGTPHVHPDKSIASRD